VCACAHQKSSKIAVLDATGIDDDDDDDDDRSINRTNSLTV